MIQSTGARPYAKYYSNGKDKLYMTYTTGHPDNEQPNWVYFNTINLNATTGTDGAVSISPTLEDIKGNTLSVIADGKFNVRRDESYKNSHPYTLVDAPTNYRDWVWQIVCDKEGHPAIAMVRINESKSQHQYYYAKWTGEAWRLTDLADGGGKFHSSNTEHCYSGGEAIDPENPNVVYLSIPTMGDSEKKTHEIWKYTLDNAGSIAAKEQITHDSQKNNVRPFVLPGSTESPLRLLWMNGDYYYWLVRQGYPLGFPTAIHGDYEWETESVSLSTGLLIKKDYNAQSMDSTTRKKISVKKSKTFTLHVQLQISESRYYGTILNMGKLSYGLSKETAMPYIEVDGATYYSHNKLYTSDNWAHYSAGTRGDSWPTPLQTLSLTLAYDGESLTAYRNGLIDQVIEARKLKASQAATGDIPFGSIEVQSYDRCLSQEEIQALSK